MTEEESLESPLEAVTGLPTHYVGIGASAGGLEAIEAFFANMPPRNGMAFIVVQHLSPNYKSLMVELLSKRTEMKVLRAEDGMPVSPDCVYLIPPKKNLSIFHGRLLLAEQDHSRGINLPIDIFLQSLAEDQREKAVAVILSGTGSDGVRGIRAIKETGGMVMVQDEESAKFDGMPKSAMATGLADYMLPPEEMPQQLLSYAKHPYVQKNELTSALRPDEDGLTRIFSTLRTRTKVDFTYYKPSTVLRRIERRMAIHQIIDLKDYVRYLEGNNHEAIALYRELLIGVTNFFRDREAFDLLERLYLPEILAEHKEGELRFWVAGCSTGEEAYSLAILCKEVCETLGKQVDVKIFATDVDSDALAHASNGVYPESIAADLSNKLLSKYFFKRDELFQITRSIREMVVFAQHNLVKDPPFTNINLVSCRNLLIYLQPVLQRKALEMFNFSLNRTGVLFLGSSETLGEMADFFESLEPKWKIYRSRGKRKLAGFSHDLLSNDRSLRDMPGGRHTGRHRILREQQEERILDRLLNTLSEEYQQAAVVVNESLEVLHIVGDASPFLRVPVGKMLNDITRMAVHELAIPLANGIQKTFKKGETLKLTNIRFTGDKEQREVQLRIKPIPGKKGQEPLVVVIFEESSVRERKGEGEAQTYDISKEAEQRIIDLDQELQLTRENLQATIEELETANEELQATNEELLASNEELQSTNEELHAVNEELYTVNAEYQRKIMELTELTNDIDNLLVSTHIGVIFLDENYEVRKFTPSATGVFHLTEADVGRHFSHISHRLRDFDPLELARRGASARGPLQEEARSDQGDWYLLGAMPYQIGPMTYSGVVLTIVELTSTKRIQNELAISERRYALAQKAAHIGTWEWDIKTDTMIWSDPVEPLFGFAPGEFGGTYRDFLKCIHPDDRNMVVERGRLCLEGKGDFAVEHRIVRPDGAVRWMAEVGAVTRGPKGVAEKMVGVVRDVTDILTQHQLLKESEERFYQVFVHMRSPCAIHRAILDPAGAPVDFVFEEVNTAFERAVGARREELVGMRVSQALPQALKGEVDWIAVYGKVALSGEPVSLNWRSDGGGKAGSVYVFRSSPNHFTTILDVGTDAA
ncbi:MAG: PAS domain-containing protein [Nitrospinae bacterium]|nr:PAS domain-containing protein [Nitrospinota bacterium]